VPTRRVRFDPHLAVPDHPTTAQAATTPDVQTPTRRRHLDERRRARIQDPLSPRRHLATLIDAVVQIQAHDAVTVQHEPEAHADLRPGRGLVRRPRRRIRRAGRAAGSPQRHLPRATAHPPLPLTQLRGDLRGSLAPPRPVRSHPTPRRARASVTPHHRRHRTSTLLAPHATILADVTLSAPLPAKTSAHNETATSHKTRFRRSTPCFSRSPARPD